MFGTTGHSNVMRNGYSGRDVQARTSLRLLCHSSKRTCVYIDERRLGRPTRPLLPVIHARGREGGEQPARPTSLTRPGYIRLYIRRRCRARTISSPMPLSCTAAQCKTASRGHPHSRNAPMQCILLLGCERQTSRTLICNKKAHAPRPSQRPGEGVAGS